MRVRMTVLALFTSKNSKRFLHNKEGRKAHENAETNPRISDSSRFRQHYLRSLPDQDVPLLLYHYKRNAIALMLPHEGMRNEVQEDV